MTVTPGKNPTTSRQRRGKKAPSYAILEPGSADSSQTKEVGSASKTESQGEGTVSAEPVRGDSSQSKRGRANKRKPWVEDEQEGKTADQDVGNSQTRTTRRKGRQVRTAIETSMKVDSPPLSETSELSGSVEAAVEVAAVALKSGRQRGCGKRVKSTKEEIPSSETPELSEETPESEPGAVGSSRRKGKPRRRAAEKPSADSQDVTQNTPAKKAKKARTPTAPTESPSVGMQESEAENKPKIMFTGLDDKQGEKIVTSLGGVLVDNVYECTHLVTDKVRRTVKFLCGLGGGQKIVQPSWLEACKKAKAFVDPAPFLIKDKAAEKQYKFSLQRSHERALEKGLLEGCKVHVTKNVKPDPAQMKDIIQCAKGQFLSTMPKANDEGMLVISCEQDRATCRSAINVGIPVCSAEVLLSGVLKQELDIKEYPLTH